MDINLGGDKIGSNRMPLREVEPMTDNVWLGSLLL